MYLQILNLISIVCCVTFIGIMLSKGRTDFTDLLSWIITICYACLTVGYTLALSPWAVMYAIVTGLWISLLYSNSKNPL